jgi:hypothetical protein
MKMQIKIKITNSLTREIVVDNKIEVDTDFETVQANHECMRQAFPDCSVSFFFGKDFICTPALNEELDEAAYDRNEITFEQFVNKWYKDANGDIPDEEVERQVDMLLEEEYNRYDSIIE